MSDTLDCIRTAVADREWTARDLERHAGISYRAAWTIVRGESARIDWSTLDHVLVALRLKIVSKN